MNCFIPGNDVPCLRDNHNLPLYILFAINGGRDILTGEQRGPALEDDGLDLHVSADAAVNGLHVAQLGFFAEIDCRLLQNLAGGGLNKVHVLVTPFTAGEGHVPAPWVTLDLGPLDQEELQVVVALPEEYGHGCV